jgi:glycosyltransferase involved in cell wall biosynthesis
MNILLIGPLPAPITGLSIANNQALKTFFIFDNPAYINTSPRGFSESLGQVNILSILHFSLSYLKSYKIFFADKVYYTPGQTFLGVIKYAPFILFSKLLGKELIVHIHGNYLGQQFKKLKGIKKIIFHRLLTFNNKGIVLSNKLIDNLSPFMPKERIFVLSNFYNDVLTKEPIEKLFSSLKICYLSNLMNEKGIHHLLWALEKLNVLEIPFEANIAGHIDPAQQKSLLERMSQIKGVNYIGVVRGADKRKLLQESNVFVLPTFYKMEGLPISIIEAMATGNIIISTVHGAIPDLVKENENGFLVKKKSVDAIVEKLLFIAKNPTKAIEISKNNTQKAKNNFTSKKFSEKLLNIIHA